MNTTIKPARNALPMSGSETTFDNHAFGTPMGKGNNNCYAWAIDDYRTQGGVKLQPGNMARANRGLDLHSCKDLQRRALADLGGRAYEAIPEQPCRRGHYKIMGFLDPGNDYHWYRQHRDSLLRASTKLRNTAQLARALGVGVDQVHAATKTPRKGDLMLVEDTGVWSHKRGFATAPILKDACGKIIKDPRTACRDYGDLNYTEFCGALCVRSARRSQAMEALQAQLAGYRGPKATHARTPSGNQNKQSQQKRTRRS
jgi:hypothetical protein